MVRVLTAAFAAILLAAPAFGQCPPSSSGSTVNIDTWFYSVYSDRITEVEIDGATYTFPDPLTAPDTSQSAAALATALDELGHPTGTVATVQGTVEIGTDESFVEVVESNYNPVDDPCYVIGDPDDYFTWIAVGDEDVNVHVEQTVTYYTFHRLVASIDCGDGEVTGDEDCDDGNQTDDGNCCSATCQFQSAGSTCNADGNECTDDVCDAGGTCGVNVAAGTPCATDGNACTPDTCDANGACAHAGLWTGCLAAPAAKLQITNSSTAGKDKLSWQWGKGAAFDQAALGDPTGAGSYALCIFDSSAGVPSLAATIDIASSATKWVSKAPKGLQYKDKAGTSDGVTKAELKTDVAGKTKIKVNAATANLALPTPFDAASFFDQDTSVTVQLVGSGGTCWTSAFSAVQTKANTPGAFKAQTK